MVDLDRLLSMPFDDLSADHISALLALQVLEGRRLEYKSKLINDVLHDIAAMANTYGGLVLIGITDKHSRPGQAVGAAETTREKLVNMCVDRFEPPFVPAIKTVHVDGRSIVVVRIDPTAVKRPVVVNGTVYVRQDHRNARADRERIRQLFSEVGPTVLTPEALSPMSPTSFSAPREPRERLLLVGAAITAPIWRQGSTGRLFIGSPVRRTMKEQLEQAKVTEWLRGFGLQRTDTKPSRRWVIRGHNTSRQANLWWNVEVPDRFLPPAGARCLVTLPGDFRAIPGASIGIHVGIPLLDTSQADPGQQVRLFDLYRLLDALVTTLSSELGPSVLHDLLDERTGPIVGPVAFVGNAHTPLFKMIDTSPLVSVDDTPGPAYFQLTPLDELDLKDADGRREQVKAWMTEMLLDGGYLDAEDRLRDLSEDN